MIGNGLVFWWIAFGLFCTQAHVHVHVGVRMNPFSETSIHIALVSQIKSRLIPNELRFTKSVCMMKVLRMKCLREAVQRS